MSRSATSLRILGLSVVLLLASGRAALADRILEERGRELLAADGRTLINRQDGFSIVLPAPDWKVYLERYEPLPDDTGFQLVLAPPDGEVRLRLREKVYPVPISLETMKRLVQTERPGTRARAEVVEIDGMRCLEYEVEAPAGNGGYHSLNRACDRTPGRKFVVEIFPGIPADRWPAEEATLRELVRSFRILREEP